MLNNMIPKLAIYALAVVANVVNAAGMTAHLLRPSDSWVSMSVRVIAHSDGKVYTYVEVVNVSDKPISFDLGDRFPIVKDSKGREVEYLGTLASGPGSFLGHDGPVSLASSAAHVFVVPLDRYYKLLKGEEYIIKIGDQYLDHDTDAFYDGGYRKVKFSIPLKSYVDYRETQDSPVE